MQVNIHQAKTHLSRLLQRVAAGEEITIARAGVPIARLVALEAARARRPLDLDRGVYAVPEDFDAPLPPEILAGFNGKPSKGSKPRRKAGRYRVPLRPLRLSAHPTRLRLAYVYYRPSGISMP